MQHTRRIRPARLAALLLVAAAAAWSLGMGTGGGGEGGGIPIPERNFSVTVQDDQGNELEAERFTWEGKVHFRATYGSATITLPFEKLRRLTVRPEQPTGSEELIAAQAELRTGETLEVNVQRTSKCYGQTRFGDYEIFVKDLAQITFQ